MELTPRIDPTSLVENIQRWLAELRERDLGDNTSLDQLQTTLMQAQGERLDAPADPLLVVMLCGPTAVGKSSLINALAGEEISRPGLGAMTKAAVLYVHEQDDPSRLFEYGEAIGQLARQPHAIVRHQRDELLHKVLIDTPDIDSVMRQHRELTAALVHAADLVLFIVSPEKYKTLDAMRWVAQQRAQRALAFVLNKWDREGIGLQYDRREEVVNDYQQVLAESGFQAPVLFKVSSLVDAQSRHSGNGMAERREEQLEELKAWLEAGLDRSASKMIQNRRRRVAWGRIAAALAVVVPSSIRGEGWVSTAAKTITDSLREGRALARTAIAAVAADFIDRTMWPSTPGLFGIYARFLTWCALMRSGLRIGGTGTSVLKLISGVSSRQGTEHGDSRSEEIVFGSAVAALFHEVTSKLLLDVETRGLPLQPVRSGWKDTGARLTTQLSLLPVHVEGDLLADVSKRSVRRLVGIACLSVIEVALGIVLLLTFWRMGEGFLLGEYLSGPIQMFNAVSLIVSLLFAGHVIANIFFPSLRNRFAKELGRRTELTVEAAWQKAQDILQEHVDAIDRLAQQGGELLQGIDYSIESLTHPLADDRELQRLFGGEETLAKAASSPPDALVTLSDQEKIPKFE
ncbi:MAG: GTPase [Candidatus Binatia bacterium]